MRMIEKIARAIYETDAFLGDPEEAVVMARAALTSILEPSEGMAMAVSDAIDEYVACRADCADVIVAAIQAALNEKEG